MSQTSRIVARNTGGEPGFSLIELAIGMALMGIILGGALLLVGKLWQHDRREETSLYLQEAKAALLRYAEKNGKLPLLDTNSDGIGDLSLTLPPTGNVGWLPFVEIATRSRDAFGAQVQYSTTRYLQESRTASCANMKEFFNRVKDPSDYNYSTGWFPRLWEKGMAPNTGAPVAAVIVSSGERKLTFAASVAVGNFDSLTDRATNEADGNRFSSNKSFVRYPYIEGIFDDIVVYISFAELYGVLKCGEMSDDDSIRF